MTEIKPKSTFPITFKTPKALMKFIGHLLDDELIRDGIKLHIKEIEDNKGEDKP